MQKFDDGRDWFFQARFGLFVHWGVYSLTGIHEQVQWRNSISRKEYEAMALTFNPTEFDPDDWLDLAEAAGMHYLCFTTKHVDGFCMWDTSVHDYKITNAAYGRDILAELSAACQKRGMPLCLYYSVADMHNKHYPQAGRSWELPGPQPGDEPDFDRYIEDVRAQVTELLTNYGEIHGFWWDANVARWGHPEFNNLIRQLQPKAVINGRGPDGGDFNTPERDFDNSYQSASAFDQPTEACQAVGRESWGYRENEDYYTPKYLMQSIDKVMARGGNYLLNVGPKPDGRIAEADRKILGEIGRWYNAVSESFLDTEPATERTDNRDVLLTQKGSTLYLHFPDDPTYTSVELLPIDKLPTRVTVLNRSGGEVAAADAGQAAPQAAALNPDAVVDILPRFFQHGRSYLRIRHLPVEICKDEVLVLKLEFDELPRGDIPSPR